jgi:DNA-binding beta-propeller fold protein YncE
MKLAVAALLLLVTPLVPTIRGPDPVHRGGQDALARPAVAKGPIQISRKHPRSTSHFEYVFPDGSIDVFDIDHGNTLVQTIHVPQVSGTRGVAASPRDHLLFMSYGGDGGQYGNGSTLALNLLTNRVVWTQHYSHGIDSMDVTPNGKYIYMPDGELSSDGKWYVVDAHTGRETGAVIDTGAGTADNGPHNTIVGLSGRYVYLGDRNYDHSGANYFYVADTRTNRVVRRVGPFKSGIRPFTINGRETLVYSSVTGFLGFQVGDLQTGHILYTVPIQSFSWNGQDVTDPSHGISLSPNEKELYVMDWPNNEVHVFDVSGVPAHGPRQIANIALSRSMRHNESPCAYDCLADGWLQHSRSGRYVYVGDSGDVIDTRTHRIAINLNALYESRKHLEIDWKAGKPVATTSRSGLGYVR